MTIDSDNRDTDKKTILGEPLFVKGFMDLMKRIHASMDKPQPEPRESDGSTVLNET